jgi:hypothetical protein
LSVQAGTSGTVTVTAEDAYGNVVTGYGGTVHLASSDAAAVLPADYTFATADQGAHTFGVTLTTAGTQSLTASDAGSGLVGSEGEIVVSPAAASSLQLSGFAGPLTAGTAGTGTITALDAYGNVATGYVGTVHFTSTGGASLPPDYTFHPSDGGRHTFSATWTTAGTWAVTVVDTASAALTATQAGIVIQAAAPDHLVVSLQTTAPVAGTAVPVTVTAQDAYGNVTTGYSGTVHFSSSDPNATLPADYTFTAADAGTHTFSAGVVFGTAGSQTLRVADTSTTSLAGSASLTVAAPPAARLALGNPSTSTAGQSFNLVVTALDAQGNVLTGYTGTVQLTSSDSQAVLPGAFTFTASDHGVHTFSVTLKTAGNDSLSASDITATGVTGSTSLTVNPGALRGFTVQFTSPTTTAGTSVTAMVTAQDAYGNIDTGYAGTVRLSTTDHQATLPANYAFAVADQGVHAFGVTFKTAGSQTLTVVDTVYTGFLGTASLGVSPAAVDHLRITGPGSVTAGTATAIMVAALDPFNNVVTSYGGTIHFTSSDVSATLPADYTFTAGDNGIHSFGASATLRTAGPQTLTATDTHNSLVTGSLALTVNPAAAARLTVTTSPTSTAGTSFSVTVKALDAFGNVATGYTGTVRLTSSDGQAVLPGNYTFTTTDRGSHTLYVTLKTAGGQTVKATDTVTPTVTGSTSVSVVPGPLRGFGVQFSSASTMAGRPITATITARDGYGNRISGYTGTVRFSSSDSQATLPAAYTFTAADGGAHTFSITFRTAGSPTLTVADAIETGFLGSAAVTVTPAAATTLTVNGFPSPVTAGLAGNFTVTARDAYGNVATGYLGTVRFGSSDAQATLPAVYTYTATDRGTHTFAAILGTAGTQSLTATDSLTATITGAQLGILVT